VSEERRALPGEEIVREGLRDLAEGRESVPALLIAIGAPRLRRLGIAVPGASELPAEPERKLYRLLAETQGRAAHSQYNAWVRLLVSLERALELRAERARRMGAA
jgi:hypothetical protein